MRSTINHFMELVAPFSQLQKEVEQLIGQSPKFRFNFADVVQYEERENVLSCSAIEQTEEDFDLQMSYPNIFSEDPIVGGTSLLKICINNSKKIEHSEFLLDPTWKDILQVINFLLTKNSLTDLVLYSIEIVGLTEDGLGYELEAVMVDPNSEYF